MYQNIKRIDRFHKRTGGYLTNSNSPTAKVQRIRDRLLKPVASTLIIIYEVDSHISNPWSHAQPTHVVQGRATKHSICGVVYFQNFHALSQSLDPTFLYSNPISPILVFRIIAAIDHYLTHGTSVGAGFITATHVSITYLPLYNILFSSPDFFAMTIHVAPSPSKAQATVIIVTHVTKYR
jgi:hypothetical protein